MTRSERMRCVAAWLRSGQTAVDYAECAGLDTDAFLRWVLEYGRPSPLVPVLILPGSGESPIRVGENEVVARTAYSGRVSSNAEQRWIPVVIQGWP